MGPSAGSPTETAPTVQPGVLYFKEAFWQQPEALQGIWAYYAAFRLGLERSMLPSSLRAEVMARVALTLHWKRRRAELPPAPFFDQLGQVVEAGHMGAYALAHLAEPGHLIQVDTATLSQRLDAFASWAKIHLQPALDPTPLAIWGESLLRGREVLGATLPDIALSEPKSCADSKAAIEAGRAAWEIEQMGFPGRRVAPKSRAELIALLLRLGGDPKQHDHLLRWVSPRAARLAFADGFCANHRGDPAAAEKALREAVDLAPLRADYRGELAHALTALRRLPEALAELDQALADADGAPCVQASLLRSRGAVLIELGNLSEAREVYRRSLTLAPEHPVALHQLGTLAKLLGGSDSGPDGGPDLGTTRVTSVCR